MGVRAISQGLLLMVLWAPSSWTQTQSTAANPCQPQQQALVGPQPAVQPVQSQEKGAPALPVAQNQHLSPHEKFKVFLRYTYSPYTFAGAGFNAGLAQATGGWHTYGGGMEGYGKRYGAALADTESGAFFGAFLYPVLLHEDPRYIRSASQKTAPRVGYALSRVFVTRGEDGDKKPNFSLTLAAFTSATLANAYYPRNDRSPGDTAIRAANSLLSAGEMNLLREFFPDIARKFRKHEPKPIQKLEENPHVAKVEEMVIGPVATPPCPAGDSHPTEPANKHP